MSQGLESNARFFMRKKFKDKCSEYQNLKKIIELNFQTSVVLLANSRYFLILAFEMLRIEFTFEFRRLTKTDQQKLSLKSSFVF